MPNDIRVTEIAEQFRFVAAPTEKFKSSVIQLNFLLPMPFGDTKAVAAHALLPGLLKRSCAKFPTARLMECRLADLYGASLAGGSAPMGEAQLLSIYISALENRYALTNEEITAGCSELLLELLLRPNLIDGLFNVDALELEKRLLTERIESEKGNKAAFARRRLLAEMCDGEAYGMDPRGTVEAISALTPTDMKEAWEETLRCAPAICVMVSSDGFEFVESKLREGFAAINRKPVQPETLYVTAPKGEIKYVRETQEVEQGKLVMGFRLGMADKDDRWLAMRLALTIFGGGVYSGLFRNVREKLSLCYYCSARPHRYKGIALVESGVDTLKEDEAKTAILNELSYIQQGLFEDSLIEDAKRDIADGLQRAADSPEIIADWYARQICESNLESPAAYEARINAVTLEEVLDAAQGIRLDTVYFLASANAGEEEVQ
ncbi:MAG: insulinase family protein [Oscillospiraceae bacterium]|jgi:predicted Zn-dependent peptidase|nr:insulinase family protein [Oscillospiraceae bacterium]